MKIYDEITKDEIAEPDLSAGYRSCAASRA